MTSKLTSIADEKIEDVIKMARESAKIYGGEWDSALIAESPGNNVHGITSDHIEAVVVRTADDSLHSSWLCDYLESVSPAFVIAALTELQERRNAAKDGEPVAWRWRRGPDTRWHLASRGDLAGEVEPLYRHAQPAKSLELAGWQFKSVNGDWLGLIDEHGKNQAVREGCEVREVFAIADGVNDRDQVRRDHAEWSQATFGNVGPVGPLKHLSKEALEAVAEPGDLSEWADIQFLLWDAQRRAGITDEEITQAMIEKLAVNKQREWPEPKDGEPRLHIKEQPAPVVPENRVTAEHRRVIEMLLNVCGAAFELADDSCQQDVDGEDCHVVPDGAFQKLSDALDEIENTLPTEDIDRPDVFLAWSAMPRAALKSILKAGNSPVIPEGYVMVPMRLTAENGAKGVLSGEFSETQFVNCPECFGDDECETCDGSGRIEIKVPVSWTTMKEIWIKGVEHFAAAPQENN